jgi:hypothetical protein
MAFLGRRIWRLVGARVCEQIEKHSDIMLANERMRHASAAADIARLSVERDQEIQREIALLKLRMAAMEEAIAPFGGRRKGLWRLAPHRPQPKSPTTVRR